MSDIYYFNPTGEMAIANGFASYMPPKALRQFECDLALMPSYFAQEGDIVLVQDKPCESFINTWRNIGLPNIQYFSVKEAEKWGDIEFIRPWSWSPAGHHQLKYLKEKSSSLFKTSPNYSWQEDDKMFFSRASCNKVQTYLQHNCKHSDVQIQKAAINVNSIDEVEHWVERNGKAVIKMPWSSSGRGVHTVDMENNRPLNKEWLRGAINAQGFVTIEPLLQKVKDFSYQLKLDRNGKIDFLGISHFINDSKGHFTGGIIHWPHQTDEISEFFNDDLIGTSAQLLIEAIKSIQPHLKYEGYLGVDGIVYVDELGQLKIHPCLDINWRYNMGNVNIQLPRFVNTNSKGIWKIVSVKKGLWNDFIENESKKKPLVISGSQIISGFIPLTPPSAQAQFGAYLEVFE